MNNNRNRNNRNRNRNRNQANALTEPYTPKQARRVANKEAQTEYGPTIRAAKQQREGSRQREKQVGEWFNTLGNQSTQAAAETDQSYGAANNALVAHANAAAEAARATQGQILANNNATGTLIGADPSLFDKTNAEGAAAANQRQIALAALSAPIAQAGASQAAYTRNVGLNTRREGIQQKQNEQKRRDTIVEDITGLRKERAAKATGNFNAIKDKEFEKAVQGKAFHLEGQKFQNEKTEGAADRAQRERELEIEQERVDNEGKGGGNDEGRTPSQKRDDTREAKSASAALPGIYKELKANDLVSWDRLTQLLAKRAKVDYIVAQRAVNRFRQKLQQNRDPAGQDVNGPSLGR